MMEFKKMIPKIFGIRNNHTSEVNHGHFLSAILQQFKTNLPPHEL